LRFTGASNDGGGGVVWKLGTGVRPEDFSGFAVEGCERSAPFVVGVYENGFAVDDR
jgi:hypothetical protein